MTLTKGTNYSFTVQRKRGPEVNYQGIYLGPGKFVTTGEECLRFKPTDNCSAFEVHVCGSLMADVEEVG